MQQETTGLLLTYFMFDIITDKNKKMISFLFSEEWKYKRTSSKNGCWLTWISKLAAYVANYSKLSMNIKISFMSTVNLKACTRTSILQNFQYFSTEYSSALRNLSAIKSLLSLSRLPIVSNTAEFPDEEVKSLCVHIVTKRNY